MILPTGQNNFYWLLPLVILDLALKGIAMWKAVKNNQKYWFSVLLIINSLGILPLIYIKFFQVKRKMK